MKWLLILGVLVASTTAAIVKRSAVGGDLFVQGKEYIYDAFISSDAGSVDFVSVSSAFNITGLLHVSFDGSNINAKFDNIKVAFYNGPYEPDKSMQSVTYKTFSELDPLSSPFSVQVASGKATGITVNGNIDKWAKNIQRGIGTALQLDLSHVDITKTEIFKTTEKTVMGECPTNYDVIMLENTVQVRKFRSHATCDNGPQKIRTLQIPVISCADKDTRDVHNSSGFGVYYLDVQDSHIVPRRISSHSVLIYNIFGVDGHTQISFSKMNLLLKSSNAGSVPAPSNPTKYDNLRFEFEFDPSTQTDLKTGIPYYFHHKGLDIDSAGQTASENAFIANIKKIHDSLNTAAVYDNPQEFHSVSPFSLNRYTTAFDYDHWKDLDSKLKGGDALEYKIFLDAATMAGTNPAALFIRDIALQTTDPIQLARVLATLSTYTRFPSENLVKEFEGLIKPDNSVVVARITELAFASMLHNACKVSSCTASGLLQKWINYWSDKLNTGATFDQRSLAALALSNVDLLPAAEKLLTVALDKTQERSVRVTAMFGLTPLLGKDPSAFKLYLLPVFYDKSEDPEIRQAALTWAIHTAPTESLFLEVVVYLWSERNPEITNYAKTIFGNLADTTVPCYDERGGWAKTALQMLNQNLKEDYGKYSGVYVSDFYDPEYHFGQISGLAVHKNGNSLLPRSFLVRFVNKIAGYGSNDFTAFIRLEGVGKTLTSRLMSMTTGVVDFDDIKEVLGKIGVKERQADPLRIEIIIQLHTRVVFYHAADQSTITTIPTLIKKLSEFKSSSYQKELFRMFMPVGVTTEQANELGLPVSTLSTVTAMGALQANVGSTGTSRNYDVRLQLNVFGWSSVSNHLPPLSFASSVNALRTIRMRLPRKMTVGLDMKQQAVNFVVQAPTTDDPQMVQLHSTAFTAVSNDVPSSTTNTVGHDDLVGSCPTCKDIVIISNGEKYREERRLGSGYKYRFMEGIDFGLKYYDCEKIHSRLHVVRQLRKFFGPDNKNVRGRLGKALTTFHTGARYMMRSLFLSPPTETCGMRLWMKQDPSAQSVFDSTEGSTKIKMEEDPKDRLGNRLMVKSSLNFKYSGAVPKSRSLDVTISVVNTGLEKTELRAKFAAKDNSTQKGGVVCIDLTSSQNIVPDFFAYEGESEPTYERTINIAWSKDVSKDATCPANSPGIKINKKAHRSQAQKDEAAQDVWPYKQCREHKNSPNYPGSLTPATEPCLWAAYKQTNLRESNISITYKVEPEARNRWKYPASLVSALLMPYWVPSDTVEGHAGHGTHGVTADGLVQGELKMDVTMDEENAEANIHWHGSQGEQEHFHRVDLNFFPGPLKRPVSARLSPLLYMAFKMGLYGYCDVTPKAVQTFDNATYLTDLADCYTLISGDCSDKPRFLVLGKKLTADTLGIKIIAGDHTVELSDLNTAIVDGKSQALSEKLIYPDDSKLLKIYKHDANNVHLISKSLSLVIRYTKNFATVTIGSRYRATQCGICGNFDGCPRNDFTGPDTTCKNVSPANMVTAYTLRDGACSGVGSACP